MKTKHFWPRCLLAVLFLTGISTANLHAQMTEGRVRFGLKIGVNGSNLYDDAKAEDRDGRIGLIGSAFVKIPLGQSKFSLRPELLFATKGASFTRDSFVSSLKSAYLELPLSLEYNLSILNLHAGLNAGYLAGSTGLFKDEQGNTINFDKDDLEKVDFGWHVGAGIDLGNIGLHFRISRGFKDVGSGQTVDGLVGSLKNSAWALTFAYGF
ncbi:MAG: PorT family protein [Lewinellaceae bacterium]|nr:PorT family protein [Lewinellaceae bacterium]